MKQHLAIIGSTGSIGTQSLDICRTYPERFVVELLSAYSNAEKLIAQALEFRPNAVVIGQESLYEKVNLALQHTDIKVFAGEKSLCDMVQMPDIDTVLVATMGFAGLLPTVNAIKSGHRIALANKEVLVVAGELIMDLALKNHVPILPVDSEHSAIFQCLTGESFGSVEQLILTASGGPFRGYNRSQLQSVTRESALKHPNWSMGAKITIDSATMMNKGFEMIEARWLFGIEPEKIEILVHPQSIVHSMVRFIDGSIKAQLSTPDMRMPILHALTFPERIQTNYSRCNLAELGNLSFEKADVNTFRHLQFAYQALEKGKQMCCILNAANEEAVAAFLDQKISYLSMQDIIEEAMIKIECEGDNDLETLVEKNNETRNFCKRLIENQH